MKKEFLISTIISAVSCVIAIVAIVFAMLPNNGTDGKDGIDGKDGVTPTIEISDDGYWVINGEKTGAVATAKPKEFVVGEEILFEDGEPFTVFYRYYTNISTTREEVIEPYTITSAKLVAVEEIPLDDPSKWADNANYDFSYKYRLYVAGYAPVEDAGQKFQLSLCFRTNPYSAHYGPSINYESTIVGEDGYFEFSVDVYTYDILTKIHPVKMTFVY